MTSRLRLATTLLSITLAALFCALPLFVHAQSAPSDAQLQTTIRQAILSDPRTSGLSAAQIDAMVSVLTAEAQKQGITSHDIQWRPETQQATFSDTGTNAAQSCQNIPGFLCALNTAFGFDGSDPTIAIGLGLTSAVMILVIMLMFEMKRRTGVVASSAPNLQ